MSTLDTPEKTECPLKSVPVYKVINGWPYKSGVFAEYTGHLIPVPKG
jgi:hypothetical protein